MVKFDPDKWMRILLLRSRPKSDEHKRYGTFNRRMIAASIDSLVITGLIAPIIDYFYIQYYGASTVPFNEILMHASEQAGKGGDSVHVLFEALKEAGYVDRLVMNTKWQFYAYVVYCVVCWHFWSATPGKLICRLQVVDAKTGGRIGTMQSILRAMFYLPSALFFGLGFFWIAFNKKRRGWHDYFAGTEVIIKQAAIKEP